uniref:Uncharacterized protein n=1 Tax=Zonotrichia albicollis TaxID=44394 RepID=A0A8D2MET0_ZONAL|nr:uncharacterized protein LOC106630140 [Zonotrichia albicollis]
MEWGHRDTGTRGHGASPWLSSPGAPRCVRAGSQGNSPRERCRTPWNDGKQENRKAGKGWGQELELTPPPIAEGGPKKLRSTIRRSTETGIAVEMRTRVTRQGSRESTDGSTNSNSSDGTFIFPTTRLGAESQFSDFLDGLGPGQLVGRQTLATPPMGEQGRLRREGMGKKPRVYSKMPRVYSKMPPVYSKMPRVYSKMPRVYLRGSIPAHPGVFGVALPHGWGRASLRSSGSAFSRGFLIPGLHFRASWSQTSPSVPLFPLKSQMGIKSCAPSVNSQPAAAAGDTSQGDPGSARVGDAGNGKELPCVPCPVPCPVPVVLGDGPE